MANYSNLPYSFEKELINRSNKYIIINTSYLPDPKAIAPTAKFYSKFDESKIKISPEKWCHYMNLVEKQFKGEPRQKYNVPVTESQKIGWIPEPLFKYDTRDAQLLSHPLHKNNITTVGDLIAANKVTQRPKFTGLPFQF